MEAEKREGENITNGKYQQKKNFRFSEDPNLSNVSVRVVVISGGRVKETTRENQKKIISTIFRQKDISDGNRIVSGESLGKNH